MPLQARPDIQVSSTDVKLSWSIRNTGTPLRLTKTSVRVPPSYCDITDHYLLGTFLLNNYKQALEILDTRSAVDSALVKVGACDMMVKEWLKEEEEYLRGLSKEPLTPEFQCQRVRPNFNHLYHYL
jgi:hypothetical protein